MLKYKVAAFLGAFVIDDVYRTDFRTDLADDIKNMFLNAKGGYDNGDAPILGVGHDSAIGLDLFNKISLH
jgi:hypothetical protein